MFRERKSHRGRGFTILELMIVVAIIAIVAAVAIPSLAEARRSANEAAALSKLRSVVSSVESFRTRFGAIPILGDLVTAGYMDAETFTNQGYTVVLTPTGGFRYWVLCTPLSPQDGNRSFAYSADSAMPVPAGAFLVQNEGTGLWVPVD